MRNRAPGSGGSSERFSSIPPGGIPRSAFDRSHSHKTTLNAGDLVPIFIDECLPGDTLNLTPTFLIRMATPIKPYMDGIHADYQFWAIPYRLVFSNFEKLMGAQDDPGDHIDYTIPTMQMPGGGFLVGSLSDYFGLPIGITQMQPMSLFHRAYNLVFNTWYRDENLTDSVVVDTDDGPDTESDYPVRKRLKRKDYFSGALPFAQKGEGVPLPIGGLAPVITTNEQVMLKNLQDSPSGSIGMEQGGGSEADGLYRPGGNNDGDIAFGTTTGLQADLAAAVQATVNEMRTAVGIQHLLERDARGGTRYRELTLSHFGVHTDDLRLDRPELLGTGTLQITPTQVPQTSETDAGTPQGNLAAFAQGIKTGSGFVKTFSEHMLVMGIISIRAELTYQQNIERMFSRATRYEFYFPDLAHLGEQEIKSREIFAADDGGQNDTWGYTPRYEEYRYRQSKVTGEFRSEFAESLDVWHLAQDFITRPVLNAAYLEENPPIERIIEVGQANAPQFLLDGYFKIKHVRPMPKFATPGLLRF